MTQRYRVLENAGAPPPKPGRPRKWGDLPLETINAGDMVELPMTKEEAYTKINAIRQFAWRIGRRDKLNNKPIRRFSVRKMDYGIGIWRVQ